MTPNTLYNSDPTKSNVGTITINFPHGGSYDMVSTNRSAPARSPPISNCATIRWCRRRRRSTSSRRRCRARCRTRPPTASPRRPRSAAGGLRRRSRRAAVRQRRSRHLQGQHHRRHAQSLDRARRRSERAAARQQRHARSERRSARRRFFRRHGFSRFPAQRRARHHRQSAILEPGGLDLARAG